MIKLYVKILIWALLISFHAVVAQTFQCNNVMSGENFVVDRIDPDLIGLLNNGTTFEHVVDQDLTNFVEVNTLVAALGTSLISVKRIEGYYSSNTKVGYVIHVPGTLLTLDLLSGLSLRTYLNDTLQESAEIIGVTGGLLSLSILSTGDSDQRRLEFASTLPFDEVELVYSGAASAITNFRIYYAYTSDATCHNDCITPSAPANFPSVTASTNAIGGFTNAGNVVNSDLNDFASRTFLLLGSAYVDVNFGQNISGGSDVGFVVEQLGLLDLLSLEVLGNITLSTYDSSGGLVESVNGAALTDVGLLANGLSSLGFKTNQTFRRVRIDFSIPVSLLGTYRVYYAFVRYDSDNDGVPDCLDNCSGGNDLMLNAMAQPLDCFPECNLFAGADISECPSNSDGAVQLSAAPSGANWSAAPGNPSGAIIHNSGLVEGMDQEGVYAFILSNLVCSDTIRVNYKTAAVSASCNRALVQPNAIIDDTDPFGGICMLCEGADAANVVSGDLNSYAEYSQLLSLISPITLIAVRDTNTVHQGGMRAGFVVSFPDGLLSAQALNAFQIRTYLNGLPADSATTSNTLLGAEALGAQGHKVRISFEATLPFDKLELISDNVLGLLTSIRIHYAFVEPLSCFSELDPITQPETACFEMLGSSVNNRSQINYDRTGFTGVACVTCQIENLSNVLSSDPTDYTTMQLGVGLLVNGSISIRSKKVFPAGYEAGYAFAADASLLDLGVLNGVTIITYLNNIQQESVNGSSGLLDLSLLPDSSGIGFLGFRANQPFDEVRILVQAPMSANPLNDLNIYYAYARLDTDGDGVPDCLEKCCEGDDNLDSDGDGTPDACDTNPSANDDVVKGIENQFLVIDALANDDFGTNEPGTFQITTAPSNGTAVIHDNDTPDDSSDDFIVYTPDSSFVGLDTLAYQICDNFGACSNAFIYIEILRAVRANDDTVRVPKNLPAVINVLENDIFGGNGPSEVPIQIVSVPTNGVAVVDNNGTPEDPTDDVILYTPDADFIGMDTFVYQICDTAGLCDTASVLIEVFEGIKAISDTVRVPDVGSAAIDVLANDIFGDNGPGEGAVMITSAPMNGSALVDNAGTPNDPTDDWVIYTPNSGFIGVDSFTYEICDAGGFCSWTTVYLEVYEIIKAINDTVYIIEGQSTDVEVLDNDTFGENGPGTEAVQIIHPPIHGSAIVNINDTPDDPTDDFVEYVPDDFFYGTDSFTYAICDAAGICDTGVVVIHIEAFNNPPVVQDDFANTFQNSSVEIEVLANDHDDVDAPQGGIDVASLSIVTEPARGFVVVDTLTGLITYMPEFNFIGTDTFSYQVCDLGFPLPAKCDTAIVIIDVQSPDGPDLVPNIIVIPSVIHDLSPLNVYLEITEVNNQPTNGTLITVIIPKSSRLNLEFDEDAEIIGLFTVDNSKWQFDNSNPFFWIFTTEEILTGFTTSVIGLSGSFNPMGTSGSLSITCTIIAGSGGEQNFTNNSDTETITFTGN
jgi:hypothetical protein